MDKKTENKIVNLIVILACSFVGYYLTSELHRDYYYIFTGQKSLGNINKIYSTEEIASPYTIEISLFNRYKNKIVNCKVDVKKSYAEKLKNNNSSNLTVVYVENDPCDLYLDGYSIPKTGYFVLHVFFAILIFIVFVLYLKKLIFG
jgi:hypothetical protein